MMMNKVFHRGPEDGGFWIGKNGNVALGQRRLAIIDLSHGGHQPMVSPDGNYAITFNGEIYNYQEIKNELSELGWVFRSGSDTEVLLYAYIQWREDCLEKFIGVFAFTIWDENNQELFAARDRLGEKPFKYYFDSEKFIFASELKAILSYPGIKREVDWQAVDSALSLRFVAAPATGLKNIHKLPAGHFLVWQRGNLTIRKYWDAGDVKEDTVKDFQTFKKEIWDLFLDSTRKRMISDVPLGAFLSGGIDSTSVVAAMCEVSKNPVETFVISMNGKSEDQRFAGIAAKYFKTNHHEIEINEIDYPAELDRLINFYDEPFFDQSALPSMIISSHIKRFVTVVLSGDGGDELFGGYDAYKYANFLQRYQKIPLLFRKLFTSILSINQKSAYRSEVLAKHFYDSYAEYYSVWKNSLPISKMYLTKDDLYQSGLKSMIDRNFVTSQFGSWFDCSSADVANRAMVADTRGRLADGYMTKMDIATMISAVEVRPPFLDHRLVELAGSMPAKFKISNRLGKYIWKEIVKDKLPAEIIDRPKAGFSIPLDIILKNQLKNKIEDVVLSDSNNISKVFENKTIRKLWQDHLDNKADYSNHIWSLLILELWIRKYIEK